MQIKNVTMAALGACFIAVVVIFDALGVFTEG